MLFGRLEMRGAATEVLTRYSQESDDVMLSLGPWPAREILGLYYHEGWIWTHKNRK